MPVTFSRELKQDKERNLKPLHISFSNGYLQYCSDTENIRKISFSLILPCVTHCNEITFAWSVCYIVVVDLQSHVASDIWCCLRYQYQSKQMQKGDYQTKYPGWLASRKRVNKLLFSPPPGWTGLLLWEHQRPQTRPLLLLQITPTRSKNKQTSEFNSVVVRHKWDVNLRYKLDKNLWKEFIISLLSVKWKTIKLKSTKDLSYYTIYHNHFVLVGVSFCSCGLLRHTQWSPAFSLLNEQMFFGTVHFLP